MTGCARAVERGKLSAGERSAVVARLSVSDDLSATAGADVIIEAVTEQIELKRAAARRSLRSRLRECRWPPTHPHFASQRSPSGRVTARGCWRCISSTPPRRCVWSRSSAVRRPTSNSSPADAWARGLGKSTVSCDDAPGFLVNRLLIPYLNDAARTCAAAGVTWTDADTLVRDDLHHPMGPFELMDLIDLM